MYSVGHFKYKFLFNKYYALQYFQGNTWGTFIASKQLKMYSIIVYISK